MTRQVERLEELLADGAGTSALCLALADYVRQNHAAAVAARQAAEILVDRLVHRADQIRNAKRLDQLLGAGAVATAELGRLPADDDSPLQWLQHPSELERLRRMEQGIREALCGFDLTEDELVATVRGFVEDGMQRAAAAAAADGDPGPEIPDMFCRICESPYVQVPGDASDACHECRLRAIYEAGGSSC